MENKNKLWMIEVNDCLKKDDIEALIVYAPDEKKACEIARLSVEEVCYKNLSAYEICPFIQCLAVSYADSAFLAL